jgi:hypothetical protein
MKNGWHEKPVVQIAEKVRLRSEKAGKDRLSFPLSHANNGTASFDWLAVSRTAVIE